MAGRPAFQGSNRVGTLGATRDWGRRLRRHHLPLAVAGVALFFLFMWIAPDNPTPLDMTGSSVLPKAATSMNHGGTGMTGMPMPGGGGSSRGLLALITTASGYVATVLLALTLLIGTLNLLMRRPNPVSSPLARDIGTWAFAWSVVHVVLGLQVHGVAGDLLNFRRYFVDATGVPKVNSFGLANWAGLLALIIVALLLVLSNDRTLRELKAKRWKNLQRTNYALFALVVLHCFFYGALLRTTSPLTWLLVTCVLVVLAGQAIGIRLFRLRRARAGSVHAEPPTRPAGSRP